MSPEKYGKILSKYGFQVKRASDSDSPAPRDQPACNRTPEPTNRRINHHPTVAKLLTVFCQWGRTPWKPDGAKIMKDLPARRKIPAGADNMGLSACERTKGGFLRGNPKHPEDRACDVLGKTTVGIRKVVRSFRRGRRELQNPAVPLPLDRDLLAVCTVVGTPGDAPTGREINLVHTSFPQRYLSRRYCACSWVIARSSISAPLMLP